MIRTLMLATTMLAAMPAFAANPFATPSTLPYQAPRFDLIKDGDYQPAIEQGMAEQIAEVKAIADNPAAPTFDNTIVALEKSGRMLDRAGTTFGNVVQANTNDTLDKVQTEEAPKLAAHQDAINLNPKLFARVKALWDKRASLGLDTEQTMLLKTYYQGMVHAGALLSPADKLKLQALNKQTSTLETAFQQKLVAGAKAGGLVVSDPKALDGLSAAEIAAAGQAAKDRKLDGKYVLPLQNTTQQPSLTALNDRETRLALFKQSWTRTEKGDANDTRALISELAQLRAQKAKLLGYPTYSDYVLYDQMAKTSAAALGFVQQFTPALRAAEDKEAADIQALVDSQKGGFKAGPADWNHYAEQIRRTQYAIDDTALKPYFEIGKVLTDGVFYAANQLYGLTFKERHDIPVYHPDVRVFEVFEENGAPLGLMYFDYWKRDNKAGGAWMNNFVAQSKLLGTKPVIYNVGNFTKPAPGQPALISFEDVTTMFHEFGHALHGLFADQQYPSLSGANTARDWVEFPSQFNEHWALDPKILAHYAVDYRTGAPMPQDLVDKLKRSQTFNQGYKLGEAITAMQLDLAWHTLPATAPRQDVDAFEAKALAATGLNTDAVPPRYRSSYFLHIWANGYASGYYAYSWTEMLDDDAFAWFTSHGGLTRANGQHFRDTILSRGHTLDYGDMYRSFAGKDPDVQAMLKQRGLK
ncbi:peptidyl-dipeptidase Dcp [Sphingomonas vulcanisoli]|uniref:Peptidyl-dipeptidase Dcp n=1 Tax=Sphingomonas vulcanisoli TaxID=1658060 RepID=A0ABX0TU87_9SPHN|nr:M3 family metallopeptidase [Sphingomonas vulcanisoli]NIJ09097.1 peptidyl-dipeptidase Dcp [Sphingomonas vulcanisoli]